MRCPLWASCVGYPIGSLRQMVRRMFGLIPSGGSPSAHNDHNVGALSQFARERRFKYVKAGRRAFRGNCANIESPYGQAREFIGALGRS